MANGRVNGEGHEYEMELARALGVFERKVALAGAGRALEPAPLADVEFQEVMNRLVRLAYADGFEKGWKAMGKIHRALK